jgi:hypothetical protein
VSTFDTVRVLLSGGVVTCCLVSALFFLRFWRATKDRLFAMFATSFFVMAANWTALSFLAPAQESRAIHYVVRLAAFLIILAAVVDKNRSARPR